ncbi:MAG: ATP-binding protein [Promethearchaeota archaeon]
MKIKAKKKKDNLKNLKIVIIGIFISIGYWLLEAIFHTFYFNIGENFLQCLFPVDLHEIWMRFMAISFIIGLSIIIQITIIKRRKIDLELEENSIFLQNLFDAIQDGISVLDRNLNIIRVNSWMEKMYSSEMPLIGKKCYSAYQQRSSPCLWCPSIKTIETGQMHSEIVPYPSEENPIGWIDLSAFPLKDGDINVKNVIEYVKDITKQIEFQNKLQKSEQQHREAFNRAEFYKDLFAHDMSNILQHLLLSIDLFKLYQNKPGNQKKIEDVMRIAKNQVIRGAKLVNNVRKLSKIEDTEIITHPIEIYNIIKKSTKNLKNNYQERNINIQIDSANNDLYVQANSLLNDIFENILNNAVQHNDHPIIHINIKLSEEQKDDVNYLKMEFIDNGIGIKDEWKEKIFQRGYMEGNSIRGMGLGLSLVKRIVECYHGHIWVEDNIPGEYSKGSKFVLLIPIAQYKFDSIICDV